MGGYVEVAKKNITWHFPWKLLRFHEFFKTLFPVHVDDTRNILVRYLVTNSSPENVFQYFMGC